MVSKTGNEFIERAGLGEAYSELEILAAHILHSGLCPLGVLAEEHLDKSMALVLVNNAGLDLAETAEDSAELALGTTGNSQRDMFYRR
jgi:hypothetical protein